MAPHELARVIGVLVGVDRFATAVFEQGHSTHGAAEGYPHRLRKSHRIKWPGPELRTRCSGEQIDVVTEVDLHDRAWPEDRTGEMQHHEDAEPPTNGGSTARMMVQTPGGAAG